MTLSRDYLPDYERKMDRFESMKILLQVVKAGSLSAAGRELRQPLATVSRKISELEAHLGAQIFTRTNRRLALTEAGENYVRSVRQILDDLDSAEAAISGEYAFPKGELIMTAPVAFGRMHVLPVVADFLKQNPKINIRLFLADRVVNLSEDHIDVAVRIGTLPDSSLLAIRLGTIHGIVCASPAYLKAHPAIKTPADVSQHDCINFAAIDGPDHWTFRVNGDDQSIPIRTRLQVNTAEAALDACAAELGLTHVLSYQAQKFLNSGTLVQVLEEFTLPPVPVHLVFATRNPMPKKLRTFLDFADPLLKNALQN